MRDISLSLPSVGEFSISEVRVGFFCHEFGIFHVHGFVENDWITCNSYDEYLHVRIHKCGTSRSRFYAKCLNYFSWKFCFVCLLHLLETIYLVKSTAKHNLLSNSAQLILIWLNSLWILALSIMSPGSALILIYLLYCLYVYDFDYC